MAVKDERELLAIIRRIQNLNSVLIGKKLMVGDIELEQSPKELAKLEQARDKLKEKIDKLLKTLTE